MPHKVKMYVVLALLALVLIMVSPVFAITGTEVTGNGKISTGEILGSAELSDGGNIFVFSAGRARENLLKNPYIAAVDIKKDYLDRSVHIDITERRVSGYVKYSSTSYLYVDKEGRILEINSSFADRLPVVDGLEFKEGFVVGEILKVDNTSAFDIMVALASLFEKYEIEQEIIRVDVSNENDIHFYYGNIDVQLGNRDDLDLKIRQANTIIAEIEDMKYLGGHLYLQDVKNPYFKINS